MQYYCITDRFDILIVSKQSCATFCRKDVFLVNCTHHDLAVSRRVKTLFDGLVSDDLLPPKSRSYVA